MPVVEGYERGGARRRRQERALASGAAAQRAARGGGGGGAGVVTQCDVSAPSARYAPAPPSVAARSRPQSVAPYAPPPPRSLSYRVLVSYHDDIAPVPCDETTWKRTHF